MYDLIYLIISIALLFFKAFTQSTGLIYPITKSLPSGEYFVLYHEGINIYNEDFILKNILYNFTSEEKINEEVDFKKTKIEVYSEKELFLFYV